MREKIEVKNERSNVKNMRLWFSIMPVSYLTPFVVLSGEDTSQLGIDLLRDLYSRPGPKIQADIIRLHGDVLQDCVDRLRPIYDTLSLLEKNKEEPDNVVEAASKGAKRVMIYRIFHYFYSGGSNFTRL